MKKIDERNVRFNILIVLVYLIGIILILQLFNLQIIHGEEYLETSSTRLTRETRITAARGNITDRNGNIIAGTVTNYELQLYKSKISTETLNNTLLNIINILEKNQDKYRDSFPIEKENFKFTFSSEEKLNNWLEENELEKGLTEEEVINKFKEKYEIQSDDKNTIRKIIGIRYGIEKDGYSTMKAYTISNSISVESVAEIEEKNASFPGISIETTAKRKYQLGSLASHIIGYVGKINEEEYKKNEGYSIHDYIGKTGVEYAFEKYLKGEDGLKQIDMSVDGTTTAEYVTKEALAGNDVALTIDSKLQEAAEKSLKENLEKINNGGFGKAYEANAGSVVVLDVKTGEVLAMCSYPDYEPELFLDGISSSKWEEYTSGESALINRTLQSAYAPGSIFKMVSAVAGLETNNITIEEQINDTGIYHAGGGYNPKCWYYTDYGRGHGYVNVSEAIKHSCNYYFYEVSNRMGVEELERYATYFGLGQKTNIELPGEVQGTLAGKTLYNKTGQTWYPGNTLSAIIGQGENNFTPIQLAKYIAMLVNGGKDIDVTIVKEITKNNGRKINTEDIDDYINERLGIKEKEVKDLKIKEENLNAILEGMKSVTTETGGTAYSVFKDFEIEIGGKTGSSEAGKKTNAWFAGFAPYNEPEIAIIVSVENGGHGYYTAEVAREIMEAYFGISEEINENRTIY
ncbi:MAG: penicillin-binding protein 2 [Clostridiales bacterium]|nr:penicillin-binding protein 2 [Clostridiales bacterium]